MSMSDSYHTCEMCHRYTVYGHPRGQLVPDIKRRGRENFYHYLCPECAKIQHGRTGVNSTFQGYELMAPNNYAFLDNYLINPSDIGHFLYTWEIEQYNRILPKLVDFKLDEFTENDFNDVGVESNETNVCSRCRSHQYAWSWSMHHGKTERICLFCVSDERRRLTLAEEYDPKQKSNTDAHIVSLTGELFVSRRIGKYIKKYEPTYYKTLMYELKERLDINERRRASYGEQKKGDWEFKRYAFDYGNDGPYAFR